MSREVAVGRAGELRPGQLREVAVGDRKVLLACLPGGRLAATSHLCPHYKAPLVQGVLSLDGRLMCPWHGACFRVQTGDIEDAPSPDALVAYPLRIAPDGTVLVTVTDDELANARRVPRMARRLPHDPRVFVVVGGGAAGWGAAEGLRRHGFTGRVVVVSREPHLPVDRPKLSKGLAVTAAKTLLRPASFFAEHDVEFALGTDAVALDTTARRVRLSTGAEVAYDRLLIATGGIPRNFWPEQTRGLANVVVVRSVADAEQLSAAVAARKRPNVVVVGSSFIGMEAAAVLVKVGAVTVVGLESVPFERALGPAIGAALQRLHETNGVQFRMQTTVERFEAADGRCTGVVLSGGDRLAADVVVLGAGVAPATEWLRGVLPLERDGSLRVDRHLRVVGQADVFAAGDLATYPYHLQTGVAGHDHVRVEHWDAAVQQGAVAAQNLLAQAGAPLVPFETVPYFWTAQYGKSLRYCGHALAFDDVIVHGDLAALQFAAYYVKGEHVLAVTSLARDPVVSKCSELMRTGAMLTATQLRAGQSPLDVSTPAAGEALAVL